MKIIVAGEKNEKIVYRKMCKDSERQRKTAKEREGLCLSKIYKNTKTKLKWKCRRGHIFYATYGDILYKKSWCRQCWMEKLVPILKQNNILKQKSIINNLSDIAKTNNGHLVSDKREYANAHAKLRWRCENGHDFLSSYSQVGIMKQWCPYCYAKTQHKIYEIIKNIFPNYRIEQNYKGFNWLKCSKYGKQEIDIYVFKIKLAIEYDGEQHFKPVRFGNVSQEKAEENLKLAQKMDKLKNRKIKQHTDDISYFIRISYKEKKEISKDFILNKLVENGVKI